MLRIDRLRIELPHSYESRAELIMRQIGDELARRPLDREVALSNVSVTVQVEPGFSDDQIAAQIAEHIHAQILRER